MNLSKKPQLSNIFIIFITFMLTSCIDSSTEKELIRDEFTDKRVLKGKYSGVYSGTISNPGSVGSWSIKAILKQY